MCSELLKKTCWYKSVFGDMLKFKDMPTNLKIVNLGSNSGKYGFDYSEATLHGKNWAVGPQALEFDGLILKQYIQHLAPEAFVLIPICPFSSILDRNKTARSNDKYHLILEPDLIYNFSPRVKRRVRFTSLFPLISLFYQPKSLLSGLIRQKHTCDVVSNPMIEEQLKADAAQWINGWKKQFNIVELGEPLSEEHRQAVQKNIQQVVEMISLCRSHQITPILVLPPITTYLKLYFTPQICDLYIHDFLNEIKLQADFQLLDYMNDASLSQADYFFNSFFLNAKGRKLFTARVINDIR